MNGEQITNIAHPLLLSVLKHYVTVHSPYEQHNLEFSLQLYNLLQTIYISWTSNSKVNAYV